GAERVPEPPDRRLRPRSVKAGETREDAVLRRVREIPEGFVAAYGDVSPGAPRFAGTVLFGADEPDLPWWRGGRADGSLAKGARQRRHLTAEGVPFRGERVDMGRARYRF